MLEDIKEQFRSVIAHSQFIDDPEVDDLFEKWKEAKRDFIEAMDGNLIWEWPDPVVSFELDGESKKVRIENFIDMVFDKWRLPPLAKFIRAQSEGFFSNQVVKSYELADGTQIPKGMKLVKAFKFFVNDEALLNEIQSAASMIIQENKVEGTLCLSVHPLDFLSLSENTHNWRSCHALDGDYRSGNLSYMVDKSTIICYLKSKRDEVLPDFSPDVKWNSKKWRVLLFFSNDWNMLFAGRQYPFISKKGLDFVKDRVLPAAHLGDWGEWNQNKIRGLEDKGYEITFSSPYVPLNNTLISMKELIQDEPGSLHYNDLLFSSCYDPVYAYKTCKNIMWYPHSYRNVNQKTRFHIGGKVKCLRCGKDHIEYSGSMMCNSCEIAYGFEDNEMFTTCSCCGERFFADDGTWVSGATELICPDCAEQEAGWCENCGELFYNEDLRENENTGALYCKYCYEENF